MDSGDLHRSTYRVFCVIAAALNPVFGAVYQATDPGGFDPLWGRLLVSVGLLLLLSLSYMVEWVAQNFLRLVQGYFYVFVVYLVGLTALNGFSPNYALGALFAFMAMGIAFSLGLRRQTAPLTRYLGFVIVLVGAAVVAAAATGRAGGPVSLWILWACVASTALIIYVAAEARLRAEGSVEASEHRFHTLMNAANDAIVIADPETNLLVDVNEMALQLTGLTREAVRRTRLDDLFPDGDRERASAQFRAHVFGGAPVPADLYVANKAGGTTPVDVSAGLIDVDGRPLVQAILRDATERLHYETQLIQAKERAEELLALRTNLLNNMSHELRTPLTAILGFAEVLAEEVEGPQREAAESVLQGGRRLHATVNSVLGLAQLEAGATHLRVRPVDLAAHLQESLALLRPLALQKGLDLRLVVQSHEAVAKTDPGCFDRIVSNLVGNAIKFTDRGEIVVTVRSRPGRVVVDVRDTGVGVSPAFLPRLFEEFQQESTGLGRSHEGSGLGLAITKRLVEVLDGEIEVQSERGVGSTFTVGLPAAEAEPEPAWSSAALLVAGPAGRRRVLVVEDNTETRELIANRLSSVCRVETAAGPDEAVALAARRSYDAFVLDINLTADRDGVDVLRALRGLPAHASTPAAAMTAYAMPGDRERFLASGFDAYLSKPFTSHEIRSLVLDLFALSGDGASTETAPSLSIHA
ncbi:hybrid sensor histidine kinase/response regulator [Rubrivirga sp. IMCC45206]|uniref:ATP-binding response regulator n=1 Tax=Rubrivirga sp. IMCC45206 TaxID=3391614 RepID=UPI0039900C2E